MKVCEPRQGKRLDGYKKLKDNQYIFNSSTT